MDFESLENLKPWNLNFRDAEVEKKYRKTFYEQSALSIKAALLLGFAIQSFYFIVDKNLLIDNYHYFWNIRIYALLPSIAIVFFLSFHRNFEAFHQIALATILTINGGSMSLGIYEYGEDYIMYFTGNIVMVAMFAYFMLAVRFTIAAATTWGYALLGIVTLSFVDIHIDTYIYGLQLIITSCGILTVGAYNTERYSRMSYIRSRQLLESEIKRYEEERGRISWLENMASFLRHELRNAVTGVKTSLELLKRKHHIQENDKYLERAGKSTWIIGNLLETVGDATSIESTFIKEKLKTIEISQLVNEQIEQYRQLFPDNKFVYRTNKEKITILGNEARMVQLLDNLVNNAVDHTVDNGNAIIISLHSRDNNCILSVANQGIPLPKDKDSIFGLFASFRKEEGVKRGFGLYIVKIITERYGGNVEVNDYKDGSGAEFIVTLPLAIALSGKSAS